MPNTSNKLPYIASLWEIPTLISRITDEGFTTRLKSISAEAFIATKARPTVWARKISIVTSDLGTNEKANAQDHGHHHHSWCA